MAATWIKPIHVTAALGVTQSLKRCLDYVTNPEKTNDGELVTSYNCDGEIAADEFMLTRADYMFFTQRRPGADEILAYHVRQAFKPGEIDEYNANELGHALAQKLTQGENAYIVATHVDVMHTHNHIVINAYNLDSERKYKNPLHSYKDLRRIADRICHEHGLSIIEKPEAAKGFSLRYKSPTKRDKFVEIIDGIINTGKPKDFDDFLKRLADEGCEIRRRGKTISVKPPQAKRFFRFRVGAKGLPEGYDEKSLREKIAENRAVKTYFEATYANAPDIAPTYLQEISAPSPQSPEQKLKLVIDLENSLKDKDSPAYKQWAQKFNLQQAAATLLFLQKNNLADMEILSQTTQHATSELENLQSRIDAADTRMKEISTLQKNIGTYNKTKEIFSQYLRSKRNADFYAKNKASIDACAKAKAFFDSLPSEKIPTFKELQIEYAALASERNQCFNARRKLKQRASDLQSAKQNAELLLGIVPEIELETSKKIIRQTEL